MNKQATVLTALAEREQAARDLSRPPTNYQPPQVSAAPERQPQDVAMCRVLSSWLVGYWLRQAARRE